MSGSTGTGQTPDGMSITISNTGDSYFTHDNAHYWDHTGADTWTYYNTKAWVGTDNLGDGPYDGGYGPILQWFHVNTGAYAGDVYIADGATYYSSDHNATGATFWDHSSDGTWATMTQQMGPTTGYDASRRMSGSTDMGLTQDGTCIMTQSRLFLISPRITRITGLKWVAATSSPLW